MIKSNVEQQIGKAGHQQKEVQETFNLPRFQDAAIGRVWLANKYASRSLREWCGRSEGLKAILAAPR